jgi:hypothetical protein
MASLIVRLRLAAFVLLAFACGARAIDLRFDVATFCCGCSPNSLCQTQFNHLNFIGTNGHFVAMGGDTHRLELATNGNALAIYYDTLNDGWTTNSATQQAALIDQYSTSKFMASGPRPAWLILNEISSGTWTTSASYRAWVAGVVHALHTTYNYNVILFSPFPNPGNSPSDWQAVAADAYIGIENYLSGEDVRSQGYSVNWCQGQYQSSINSYTALGVPRAKLMLGENFSQTISGTPYGRAGIASNEWEMVVQVRSQAAQNVGYAGFLTYAWSGNGMGVSEAEQVRFEDVYASTTLPTNSPVHPPFVVQPPLGQTVPVGTPVTFTVFPAGDRPTTYQWQFRGTNISGATASALSLGPVAETNAGNYSVVLNNSAGTTTSSNADLRVQVPPPQAYEPFAPATTAYIPDTTLIGQTNATGRGWTQAGPNSLPAPIIQAASLPAGGLDNNLGNSARFGGLGMSARFNLGTNITTGTWYYSFVMRMLDTNGMNTTGVFWAGFNNSAGTQTTTPLTVGARLVTKIVPGGYSIGLDKSSGNVPAFVFDSRVFGTNDVVFVVAGYSFNTATTNDDVAQLWINPPSSSFGLGTTPPPNLISTATNDVSPIASFVLFNRSALEPASGVIDELRVANSWASVTPPGDNSLNPSLGISVQNTSAILNWTTNAPGFLLEKSASLFPAAWTTLPNSMFLINDQYFITNPISGSPLFYRLRYP